MRNLVGKFWALESAQKRRFIQAYFLLGVMRARVLLTSFKRLSKALQHHPEKISDHSLEDAQLEEAIEIGQAVRLAARYTLWDSNCLAQALTAQRMLKQRGIGGMFFLGVKKDQQQLEAHAWLQCDEVILTGGAGHEQYTVVSMFSW